jgi:hypothetical protein
MQCLLSQHFAGRDVITITVVCACFTRHITQSQTRVIALTAYRFDLRFYRFIEVVCRFLGGYFMSDPFADSTALLERLVAEVIKETDSMKCDELCAEIRRVLAERERLRPINASYEREPFV